MSNPKKLVKFMKAISKKFLKRGETTRREITRYDYPLIIDDYTFSEDRTTSSLKASEKLPKTP